jgi:hypothetical protein
LSNFTRYHVRQPSGPFKFTKRLTLHAGKDSQGQVVFV